MAFSAEKKMGGGSTQGKMLLSLNRGAQNSEAYVLLMERVKGMSNHREGVPFSPKVAMRPMCREGKKGGRHLHEGGRPFPEQKKLVGEKRTTPMGKRMRTSSGMDCRSGDYPMRPKRGRKRKPRPSQGKYSVWGRKEVALLRTRDRRKERSSG